jgi:acetolactate synthase-1/2/3 large subunit
MNVAETIVQALVSEKVQLAAGIYGESIGRVVVGLANAPKMKLCYTRQERVAVDIADGYARVSGRPAVVFADAGPAAANAMGGVVNSFGDSTPLLFLAGQIGRFEGARRAMKELPMHDVFGSVTKLTATIADPSQLNHVVRQAFVSLRTGRPGPVVLELPQDVQSMEAPEQSYRPVLEPVRAAGDPKAVEAAVRLLAGAERPYVYVGAGILFSTASEELVRLAELLSLPVATTLNGKSAFPEDHLLSLGIGGFSRATYGTLQATRCAQGADVVLTIGCTFKAHTTKAPMPEGITHIQVDTDPSEMHKETRADIAILGDAKLVLQQMIEAARTLLPPDRLRARPEVAARIERDRCEWLSILKPLVTSPEKPIHPFRVTAELSQLLDPAQSIVLHDAGSVRGSTCQPYIATTPRSFIGFGGQSAMGWSLGAGVGAKLGAPDKLVVAVMGDEAFGETALDLETAVRSDVPILVVVKNNSGHKRQDVSDPKRAALVSVRFKEGVDFCALARSVGARASRVEEPDALRGVLSKAIESVRSGNCALVEVATQRFGNKLF